MSSKKSPLKNNFSKGTPVKVNSLRRNLEGWHGWASMGSISTDGKFSLRKETKSFCRWCKKAFSPFSSTFSDGGMAEFWPNACTTESNGTSHQHNRKHLDSPSKAATEVVDSHCRQFKSDLKLRPLGVLSFQFTFLSSNSVFLCNFLSCGNSWARHWVEGLTFKWQRGSDLLFSSATNEYSFGSIWSYRGDLSQARSESLKNKILKDKTWPSSDHSRVDTFKSPVSKNDPVGASTQVRCLKGSVQC